MISGVWLTTIGVGGWVAWFGNIIECCVFWTGIVLKLIAEFCFGTEFRIIIGGFDWGEYAICWGGI
jgi:hypothetical protein